MFDEVGLTQILDVLYEAPANPSHWQDFLRLAAQTVKGEAGALLLHDFTNVQSFVERQWNIDHEVPKWVLTPIRRGTSGDGEHMS